MKRHHTIPVLAAAMLLAGACTDEPTRPPEVGGTAPAASRADVYKFRSSGQGASAYFSSDDGCVYTATYVEASLGRSTEGSSGYAYASVYQYDYCAETLLLDAVGSNADFDLQVGNRLDAATLTATIPVYDYVNEVPFNLSVNVAWTATGRASRGTSHSTYTGPGFTLVYKSSGASRPAEASGSISDGTTNYAPNSTSDARIYDSRFSEVTISRTQS